MTGPGDFSGKIAIVTGAGRGIGTQIAGLLAARGAKVVLTARDAAAEEIAAGLPNAAFVRLDVTSADDWAMAVARTRELFGGLDILVNNAGLFTPGRLQDTSEADLERLFQSNQLGVMLGMQAVVGAMAGSSNASITNISSVVAMRGVADQFAYAATKWAVRGMTKCAAIELGPLGIRVNSVHPGPSETRMIAGWTDEKRVAITRMIPLGRLGHTPDTAEAVAFLASDAAAYISGAELLVDGGLFA